MGPSFGARGKIYALQLDPEAEFPFTPPTELTKSDDDADTEKDEDKEGEKEEDAPTVKIAFDGLSDRLYEVPVQAGDYTALATTDSHIFVVDGGGGDLTYTSKETAELKWFEITDEKPEMQVYAGDIAGFALSADASKLFVQTGRGSAASFLIVDAGKDMPKDAGTSTVRLADWTLRLDPKAEWEQMAQDAWRLHRDFAFDSRLRSVDWAEVGDHYLPFASRLGHRTELNDLLAQMSSELGILHSQIRAGDQLADAESGAPASLGADVTPVASGLEITSIWDGERDRPDTLGPLLRAGVDIREGDIIQSIDGRGINSLSDLSDALDNRAGQQVLLEVSRAGKSHREIIVPVSLRDARNLRYLDWVEHNRKAVAEATDGEIGYLHLRAMGAGDIASFARDYYEHFDKDGLIIDVRGNRGGNIDSLIIGTLLRKAWAFWQGLEGGPVYTNMQQAFRGHLVVLIDEGTYSDGESFAAGVKALEIAPLLGEQTAGAGIWLSDRNRLVDGGQSRVAEYAQYGMDGRWLLEGRGVSPDIVADNLPLASYQGRDNQLEQAMVYLRNKIASDPIPQLVPQAIPPVGTTGRDVRD